MKQKPVVLCKTFLDTAIYYVVNLKVFILFFSILFIIPLAYGNSNNSLCKESEKVFFNCKTKRQKIISLCGSQDLAKNQGYLQYRFGKKEKVELTFPKKQTSSAASFFYAHYSRFKTDYLHVNFSNDGTQYSIFVNREDDRKQPLSSGVTVTSQGKKDILIYCSDEKEFNLQALEKIVSCDADDALTGGNCPQ